MEVVIPTRNDYEHLPHILQVLDRLPYIHRVIIVDNASNESYAHLIQKACVQSEKGEYHICPVPGKGRAVQEAIKVITDDVLFLDADIKNLSERHVRLLQKEFAQGYDLVKAHITRANGQSNSAFVLDKMQRLFPTLPIHRPTCGLYCATKELLSSVRIPPSWNVDVSILLQAHLRGARIGEVFLGEIVDKPRSLASLEESRIELENELEVMTHEQYVRV